MGLGGTKEVRDGDCLSGIRRFRFGGEGRCEASTRERLGDRRDGSAVGDEGDKGEEGEGSVGEDSEGQTAWAVSVESHGLEGGWRGA